MFDSTLEERIEKAEMNWQSAYQGSPGVLNNQPEDVWGFFSYGDASPAIGGGVGLFVWFIDRNAMLEFIKDTLPYSPPGVSGCDWDEVASNTTDIVEKMNARLIEDQIGIQQLNEVLKTFSQIEWVGTFAELLQGDHPYAIEVRKEFHNRSNVNHSENQIQPEETKEFCKFLEEWGF